jgi:hypothetical protein
MSAELGTSLSSHLLLDETALSSQKSELKQVAAGFFCGSLGGVANILVGHPLDTIKVRQQMLQVQLSESVKRLVVNEGPFSLYKGLSSPLYNVPLIYAVYLATYELGKAIQGIGYHDNVSIQGSMVAGAFSGILSSFIITPVQLVKCKLQMEGLGKRADSTKAIAMTRTILASDGLKGLFRGNLATVCREIPGCAVFYGTYEYTKNYLQKNYGNLQSAPLIAGGLAGFVGALSSYPQDVLKTKLQCDIGNGYKRYKNHHLFRDGGIINCCKEIHSNNGFTGFWRGFPAWGIKAIIAESITFWVYEKGKNTLFSDVL